MASLSQTSYATQFMCCDVASMFGYSLQKGVVIVGITTTVISAITMLLSILGISTMSVKHSIHYNHPVEGVNLIFSLYCVGISAYQIVISALLLWKSRTQGDIFICSLWYVSHLSIIVLSCLLFITRAVACFNVHQYLEGSFTIAVGILYEGIRLCSSIFVLLSIVTLIQLIKKYIIVKTLH